MQPRRYLVSASFDGDLFQLAAVTTHNFYGSARNIECLRQNSNQLFISGSVNRRRGDPHTQRTVVFAHHFAARGSRYDLNPENHLTVAKGMNNHLLKRQRSRAA